MRLRILACLFLFLLYVHGPSCAQEALPEADLKAAFLYNFSKFVDWPADAFAKEDAAFVVGVFAEEEFAATLRKLLEDKKAHGHPFIVRRLTQNADAQACQMLFFRESETRRFGVIYDSIKRLAVLTVGESDSFLEAGGMFNLAFEDKQLRFEVNPAPADNSRLTISSKLLRLARKVRKGGAK